jgi:hypothetical protein
VAVLIAHEDLIYSWQHFHLQLNVTQSLIEWYVESDAG